MWYLLYLTFTGTDTVQTLTFASAFARGLFVVALAGQPVTVRLEDRPRPAFQPTVQDLEEDGFPS